MSPCCEIVLTQAAGIVCSVVPDLNGVLAETAKRYFDCDALFVGPGLKTGMPILMDNPKEVGADRIVNAVAAYRQFRNACIVVDFGTATTFDCISAKGEYLGGVIVPGIGISLEALFQNASPASSATRRGDTIAGWFCRP